MKIEWFGKYLASKGKRLMKTPEATVNAVLEELAKEPKNIDGGKFRKELIGTSVVISQALRRIAKPELMLENMMKVFSKRGWCIFTGEVAYAFRRLISDTVKKDRGEKNVKRLFLGASPQLLDKLLVARPKIPPALDARILLKIPETLAALAKHDSLMVRKPAARLLEAAKSPPTAAGRAGERPLSRGELKLVLESGLRRRQAGKTGGDREEEYLHSLLTRNSRRQSLDSEEAEAAIAIARGAKQGKGGKEVSYFLRHFREAVASDFMRAMEKNPRLKASPLLKGELLREPLTTHQIRIAKLPKKSRKGRARALKKLSKKITRK